MAQNKIFRTGPVDLGAAAANILNCNITSLAGPVGITIGQPYLLLKKITVVNKTGGAVTYSLFIGATGGSAAGTEYLASARSVAANSRDEINVSTRLDAADFLTGLASAGASLTIEIEGEVGISG